MSLPKHKERFIYFVRGWDLFFMIGGGIPSGLEGSFKLKYDFDTLPLIQK